MRIDARIRMLGAAPLLAAALASCRSAPETDEEYIAAFLEDNPYVYDKLDSQDGQRRQEVINGLLSIPERRHAQTILRYLLDDPNMGPRGRAVAAGLLASEFKDGRAATTLMAALQGPPGFERQVAVDALRVYGDRIVPQLEEIYSTGLDESRMAAAEVLSGIRTKAAIDALRSRLQGERERNAEIRATAVLGILEYKGPESVDYLIDCLADSDVEIRRVVWNALRQRTNPPVSFDPEGSLESRAGQLAELRLWRKRSETATRIDRECAGCTARAIGWRGTIRGMGLDGPNRGARRITTCDDVSCVSCGRVGGRVAERTWI
ncbi:MAG: HEAT repeat domain-containing protein [Planctomycetes bacterium]|nr:HEAT repeat domain-containing protein [Planctomycetota bacterium]